jgi:hypothetical protein
MRTKRRDLCGDYNPAGGALAAATATSASYNGMTLSAIFRERRLAKPPKVDLQSEQFRAIPR